MKAHERELLAGLVNRLLRHPDEAKDIDAERALQRLVAARFDAAYLLLQRALVLEVALGQVRRELERLRMAPTATVPGATEPGPPPDTLAGRAAAAATARLPARGFLRDAAVISAGVLGGSLLARGAESLFDGEGDAGAGIDLDLDGLF